MPLPTRPPSIDDDFYRESALNRQDQRLSTVASTRPDEYGKLTERKRKGQELAGMYSQWASDQQKQQRERDLQDVDKAQRDYSAKAGDGATGSATDKQSADWLANVLGIAPQVSNPMVGPQLTKQESQTHRYGIDTSGADHLGATDVLDMRQRPQAIAPAPVVGRPVPAPRGDALTPEMAAALAQGNVTGAPQQESAPAMYELMANDAQSEANRRMRGLS